jgi:hypothetical protein
LPPKARLRRHLHHELARGGMQPCAGASAASAAYRNRARGGMPCVRQNGGAWPRRHEQVGARSRRGSVFASGVRTRDQMRELWQWLGSSSLGC